MNSTNRNCCFFFILNRLHRKHHLFISLAHISRPIRSAVSEWCQNEVVMWTHAKLQSSIDLITMDCVRWFQWLCHEGPNSSKKICIRTHCRMSTLLQLKNGWQELMVNQFWFHWKWVGSFFVCIYFRSIVRHKFCGKTYLWADHNFCDQSTELFANGWTNNLFVFLKSKQIF